jgi:uridine kinase
MPRSQLLGTLARRIAGITRSHPVRVAIDGVDASGKTTLADELAQHPAFAGRDVIRASIDGFHFPRAHRQRTGSLSPEGYYFDSFDTAAICEKLLKPLGAGGNRTYVPRVFDYRTDQPVSEPPRRAQPDSVLLFDGVFLLRPELNELWDLRVFVQADFDVTVRRAERRDLPLFGDIEVVRERYRRRYIPGQRLYLSACQPRELADVVVDNNEPARPRLLKF